MARNVVAIYDDFQTANNAVRDLVDHGYARENISIIANNARGEYRVDSAVNTNSEKVADETGAGAGVGAGIGAAIGGIGGLLVGLGALTIPGIGPVIAAGPLAVALSTLTGAGVGAVAGGVTGGLLGALIGLGIPEEEAEYYAEGVRRGGVLVTVQAEETGTDQVIDVLNRHSPVNINTRVEQWRSQGWTGYDPNAGPFSTNNDAAPINTGISEQRMEAHYGTNPADKVQRDVNNAMDRDVLFRNHYDSNLSNSGYPYDYYAPAYQYGAGLRQNPMFQGRDWDTIETEVQRDWERQHPETWDRFSNAIRHAWDDPVPPV